MLTRGEGEFGATLNFGWMLNYEMLEKIPEALDFMRLHALWLVELMESSEHCKRHILSTVQATPTGSCSTASR